MSSYRTVVLPLVGFHTTDMLKPLVFKHQSLTTKVGEIRQKVTEKLKHIDSSKLGIYLKGKYSDSGVADKLEDDVTLKAVLKTIQKGHAREMKAIIDDELRVKKLVQQADDDKKQVESELRECEEELQNLKNAYNKKERKTKELLAKVKTENTTAKESKAVADMREDRRAEQNRTKELEEKSAILKRKAAAARASCNRLDVAAKDIQTALKQARTETDKFEKGDILMLMGIKREGGQTSADQQVKMLDIMVSQIRNRRSEAGNRLNWLKDELEKINGMINELERKKAKINTERLKRMEQRDHLINNVQSSSIRQFEELIALSRGTMRKSNTAKSDIDKVLAKTRLLLARGYSNESHRKDAKRSNNKNTRRSVLRNTGKSITRQ
mmetsp:Transcript_18576/g.25847  ORF Transcript_18576/g.25847 Transcript_18576/m.25847 type:complete len:383 (-) Transcript_18576:112-1260(-)|eukprot:CAMPEP_0184494290 /NCGR_PEP_ID=MMETSP0113_2-20130426/28348_1 /TAXON_ID=91329 /ORGANISM="Norrisiella sphaerica, Strain BC52" /LENGTH=382 /DNA_ID=CAMNT_0026879995 /DNA_START=90 /DNA_END=1238 /DNA_ORIENTATION=-